MAVQETEAPDVAPLITGYFKERRNYSTWRSQGTHDYLLMLTLSGKGRIGYAVSPERNEERIVSAGDIVLITPGTRHDYGTARGAEGWELLWAHFLAYPHWEEWLHWPEIAPGISKIGVLSLAGPVREAVTVRCWEMHRRANGELPRREAFAMNALEEALLWCDSINPQQRRNLRDPRVERAMLYLRAHLSEPIGLADLARSVGLSSSRLSHLFREQTGQTPGQFIEQERMARAQQLLALTARPIGTVAYEVGFQSPFYFTLRFRKYTGMSPREYRQWQIEGEEYDK